ncbi:DUF4153 domain-containing protein [Chryseobacterium salipaludis]|uniref:DUF4153 domain-containing protein n=1 Tax=Chryseobacterium TaxID=59732 RepID=UPI001FF1121A|nr:MULTISPECIES: DUF4153 domain-containing protein [Chryseobacterium]MCJ8497765.1 DUF4153 domain-containing protein [Chryseobacterium salipaludis]MCX3297036.1 DUF4153 domain-containing protein [Planobacterium sp. JC490]
MAAKIKALLQKLVEIIRLYPFVLLSAITATVCMIISNDFTGNVRMATYPYTKITIVAALGISLFFGLRMLTQQTGKKYIFQIAGLLLLLILLYFILPADYRDFTEVYAYLLIPAFLISHLFVAIAPFVNNRNSKNFWNYNILLFIRTVLTAIFTGVMTVGLLLAMASIDELFMLRVPSQYYANVSYTMLFAGSSIIFLLFNSNGLADLKEQREYPQVLKFFTQFILIPLLLLYSLILYVYLAKIIISWELPRGWVSYLILAYAMVGILALLLVHPLKEESRSWVQVFDRIFYYSLLPLLVLLFVAIFTRVLEYGFTEPRYFVLALAIWLTIIAFYFITSRDRQIRFIPLSLVLTGLFAIAFPYFNAFSVSKRSQENELLTTLRNNNLLINNTIAFSQKVPEPVVQQISSQLVFLAMRNEHDLILGLIPDSDKVKLKLQKRDYYTLGFTVNQMFSKKYEVKKPETQLDYARSFTLKTEPEILPVADYSYLFKAVRGETNQFNVDGEIYDFTFPLMDNTLTLKYQGGTVDLTNEIAALFSGLPAEGTDTAPLQVKKKIGTREFIFLLESVTRLQKKGKADVYMINSETIVILVK